MKKLVSIIIPYRDESLGQMRRVLSSVNNQVGISLDLVEVILICDGGTNVNAEHLFDEFDHLEGRFYRYEDSLGPGVARQIGMDMATGKYYMFMDADDQLQYTEALYDFFTAVKNGDHQMIVGRYVEEVRHEDGSFTYREHAQKDWQSSVAKWFNREYLASLSMTWREDLRIYEDCYFVGVCCAAATDIQYLDSAAYLWMWNDQALSRVDDGHEYWSQLDQWAKANRYMLEKVQAVNPDHVASAVANYFAETYLRMQRYPAADPNAFQIEHEKLLHEFAGFWPKVSTLLSGRIDKMIQTRPEFHGLLKTDLMAYMVKQLDHLQASVGGAK